MAESVDALVSNTSGATHPGSIPGLGTKRRRLKDLLRFSFPRTLQHLIFKHIQFSFISIHATKNCTAAQSTTIKHKKPSQQSYFNDIIILSLR